MKRAFEVPRSSQPTEPAQVDRLRRTLLLAPALALALPALAQDFPQRPLHLLVGYSAGGAVDVLARSLGEQLAAELGQPVVVEDRPGAATNIAVRDLIASAPDGYTLMLAANALAANVSLFQPPPYDLAHGIEPVALLGRVPVVLAAATSSRWSSLAGLVAAARHSPGSITCATPGNGSTPHLALGLFEHEAGISITQVPYKGGSQAIVDALAGNVDLVAVNALEVASLVQSGKLRVLGVMSAARSAVLPGAPTVAEQGYPGFEASVWYGLIAPAATPAKVVARLNQAVQQALESAPVRARFAAAGGTVSPGTPGQFGALIESERVRYARLIGEASIKPD